MSQTFQLHISEDETPLPPPPPPPIPHFQKRHKSPSCDDTHVYTLDYTPESGCIATVTSHDSIGRITKAIQFKAVAGCSNNAAEMTVRCVGVGGGNYHQHNALECCSASFKQAPHVQIPRFVRCASCLQKMRQKEDFDAQDALETEVAMSNQRWKHFLAMAQQEEDRHVRNSLDKCHQGLCVDSLCQFCNEVNFFGL